MAILLVSHSPNTIIEFCDRAAYLDRGRLVASGNCREILERYTNDSVANLGGTPLPARTRETGEAVPEPLQAQRAPEAPAITDAPAPTEILAVTVTDAAGTAKQAFSSGDALHVRVDVAFHRENTAPCFGIQIKSTDDIVLWTCTTQILGLAPAGAAGGNARDVGMEARRESRRHALRGRDRVRRPFVRPVPAAFAHALCGALRRPAGAEARFGIPRAARDFRAGASERSGPPSARRVARAAMTAAARGPVAALRRFRSFLANGLATARRDGAAAALRIGLAKLARRLRRSADGDARDAAALQAWRERYPRRPLVVLPPLVDWDMTLFQRPQHMARALAEAGFLYLFCVRGERDRVAGLRELAPGLALTDRFDLVSATMGPRLWHVYSTDLVHDLPSLRARMRPGDAMIYEYIDRIDDAVARRAVPAFVHARHAELLADPDVAVVASADALAEEVRAGSP